MSLPCVALPSLTGLVNVAGPASTDTSLPASLSFFPLGSFHLPRFDQWIMRLLPSPQPQITLAFMIPSPLMVSGFSEVFLYLVFQQGSAGDIGWLMFLFLSEKAAIWDQAGVLLEGAEARGFLWWVSFCWWIQITANPTYILTLR